MALRILFWLIALSVLGLLVAYWWPSQARAAPTYSIGDVIFEPAPAVIKPFYSKIHVDPPRKTTRTFWATVTAYNSVEEQTDGQPCLAANGENVCLLRERDDQTCAANGLPFGQRLAVAGFGDCTVRDRTSAKYTGRIDLYFGGRDRIKAAKQWGKRWVKIEVIE